MGEKEETGGENKHYLVSFHQYFSFFLFSDFWIFYLFDKDNKAQTDLNL